MFDTFWLFVSDLAELETLRHMSMTVKRLYSHGKINRREFEQHDLAIQTRTLTILIPD